MMSRVTNNLLCHMPFYQLTDYALQIEFETTKNYILSLMKENGFNEIVKENKILNSMNSQNAIPCMYYDAEEFVALNRNGKEFLNIFSLNISSLPKHASELTCYLYTLETTFDIIVLSEIGKTNIDSMTNLFKGFDLYFDSPSSNTKGGVGIFVSHRLGKVTHRNDLEITKSCNCVKCEIESVCVTFTCYDIHFIILGLYRHPRGNKRHFIKDLENTLQRLDRKHVVTVTGDMNIDLMRFNTVEVHSDYASMLFSNEFLPFITFPTRITSHSATLIDHVFIRTPSKEIETVSGIFYASISDHLPNFVSLKCIKSITNQNRPMVRLYGTKQCNKFVSSMESFDWEVLYRDNNDIYQNFVSAVYRIFECSFPKVTVSRARMNDKPWITRGLKISCKTNTKLYKASINRPNPQNSLRYKNYNRIYKSSLRKAEIEYYSDLFRKKESSIRDHWKNIGNMINHKQSKNHARIDKLHFKGKYLTTDKDISNAMNEHFCTVGESLQGLLPPCDTQLYKDYLGNRITNSFVLSHILYDDIIIEMSKLDPKKSTGPDGIGAKIIKLCPQIFAQNLVIIFNRYIDLGEYPSGMKLAKVIALYKKSSKCDPNNYRPISLLSCFNKLFERLICRQLYSFLTKYKILIAHQFGFRALYSTILALTEITDTIRSHLDDGNYVLGLFVDLSKAFDTVHHEMLLYKMEHSGIRGHANKFFYILPN